MFVTKPEDFVRIPSDLLRAAAEHSPLNGGDEARPAVEGAWAAAVPAKVTHSSSRLLSGQQGLGLVLLFAAPGACEAPFERCVG